MDKQVLEIIQLSMIPVEIFEEIALEDEKLLWAGKQIPEYVKAQKTIKLFLSLCGILLLGFFASLCANYAFKAYGNLDAFAFSTVAWGLGVLVFAYLIFSVLVSTLGNLVVANMHMFITDQRLLLVEPNLGIRRIFTGRPFQELMVVRDKKFVTLKASGYANDEKQGHHLKIRGLGAAEEAEKLIQYYFMETTEQSS